jgi:hypothetical protein
MAPDVAGVIHDDHVTRDVTLSSKPTDSLMQTGLPSMKRDSSSTL